MSKNTVIKNVDDRKTFKETINSMKNIFSEEQISEIMRILSAVLLLGNIEFE
jgi:myosin heavy subunit